MSGKILWFLSALVFVLATSLVGRADQEIEPHGTYWSNGCFLGRPLKSSEDKGMFYGLGTMELEISYGAIEGHDKYLGLNSSFSTKSNSVLEKFRSLDLNKTYVFIYEYPYPLNPVWNDTHWLITDIKDVEPSDSSPPFEKIEVPKTEGRFGTYSPDGSRNGILVEVERWGFLSKVCTLTLHLGGMAGGQDLSNVFTDMVIHGEKNCAAAEALLPFTREVRVGYSQDFIEVWEGSTRIVHSIDVLAQADLLGQKATGAMNLSEIQRALLEDPVFLKKLKKQLDRSE
ncbi:MAG: hypothetical protein IPJ71_03865 [Bdellovibrionales bacterium]|nr:hypothetical protein [Bdellovibrionales bacterium]